jgi:diguanylate cyclase
MNTKQTNSNTYTETEYAESFAIAKEALGCIAKFQTPPTPDVYEVWYRYAEGDDPVLCDSLAYYVNDAHSISKAQISQVRNEFFAAAESAETNSHIGNKLAEELGGLKTIVNDQLAASGEFDSSLGNAAANLGIESSPDEAKACIELALSCNEEMQGHLKKVTTQLEQSQNHIDEMRDTLLESQKLLLIDPVTEVGNRRFFDAMMEQNCQQGYNPESHKFLLIVDLDEFKDVNDCYGHSAGDRVLQYVASTIQELAKDASVARYGGDEFAIFLECDRANGGIELGEAICQHFARTPLQLAESAQGSKRVTTSIGVARLRDADDRESWFNRADKLLYGAKQSGRNQVMVERDLSDTAIG